MKCTRLHLQDRSKIKAKAQSTKHMDQPKRYCQKRLVNPEHEEDPRWMDIWNRFHCNLNRDEISDDLDHAEVHQEEDNIVLTVQTLKFLGDVERTKRPRTSFKYKNITDGNKHRMFVKQVVTETEYCDEDNLSHLTYYYFDDYVKYLYNSDRSRPNSGKSSVFLKGSNNLKQNKSTQVDGPQIDELKKVRKAESKVKKISKPCTKQVKEEVKDLSSTMENTKIIYQNNGKRKSLTISRAQSPETVQVIRVDVVCNYSGSSKLSDCDETKQVEDFSVRSTSNLENLNVKSHFTNKYLLTNSFKTLDESLCGGSKVTLLCKTFKLSDRLSKQFEKPCLDKNRKRSHYLCKELTKNHNKGKSRK